MDFSHVVKDFWHIADVASMITFGAPASIVVIIGVGAWVSRTKLTPEEARQIDEYVREVQARENARTHRLFGVPDDK
jgi:hypothetical protein